MGDKMSKDPYQNLAKLYDAFVEPSVAAIRKMMLKMYLPQKGMRVLEVGCGTGTNLKLYQQAGCEVYGIDLSASMLKVATRKLGEQAQIKLGDASQMPYLDNYFDLVITMLTLHEMPNSIRSPIMNEMSRVVKQDGRLLFVDFHPGPLRFPKGWLYKINILFFERVAGREHFRNYRDFLESKGLPPLIEKNNLFVEKKKIVSGGNLALFSVKTN
ncbi:MAG: class I SAM-dependent methyltransferase [Desulfobacteraceae bacterium]|nr:class I SAM-dependent methyltransferase [Desulfobacteraceae bacterium]